MKLSSSALTVIGMVFIVAALVIAVVKLPWAQSIYYRVELFEDACLIVGACCLLAANYVSKKNKKASGKG